MLKMFKTSTFICLSMINSAEVLQTVDGIKLGVNMKPYHQSQTRWPTSASQHAPFQPRQDPRSPLLQNGGWSYQNQIGYGAAAFPPQVASPHVASYPGMVPASPNPTQIQPMYAKSKKGKKSYPWWLPLSWTWTNAKWGWNNLFTKSNYSHERHMERVARAEEARAIKQARIDQMKEAERKKREVNWKLNPTRGVGQVLNNGYRLLNLGK